MTVCLCIMCGINFLDLGQRSDRYGSVSNVHPQLGRSVSIGTRSKSQASKGSSERQCMKNVNTSVKEVLHEYLSPPIKRW